jgi:hypothetical protein
MKISPYTSYLELQPNALLVRQIFYYLQKVGVTILIHAISRGDGCLGNIFGMNLDLMIPRVEINLGEHLISH